MQHQRCISAALVHAEHSWCKYNPWCKYRMGTCWHYPGAVLVRHWLVLHRSALVLLTYYSDAALVSHCYHTGSRYTGPRLVQCRCSTGAALVGTGLYWPIHFSFQGTPWVVVGPDLANFDPTRPELGRLRVKFDRVRPTSSQIWSSWARIRPTSARVCSIPSPRCPKLAEVGPTSAQDRQLLARTL